jgi:hypothetical protein
MGERSNRREVRNPLLALPAVQSLTEQPAEVRALLVSTLKAIQTDARVRAELAWRTHKAPMAVYWKAVGVYAGHLARVLR